jgi:hypothetical protein
VFDFPSASNPFGLPAIHAQIELPLRLKWNEAHIHESPDFMM